MERPILFSAPMVRAILSGDKSQTRRVIKPQPRINGKIVNARAGEIVCEADNLPPSALLWDVGKHRITVCDLDGSLQLCCPYGQPGDRLWVKETWAASPQWDGTKPTELPDTTPIRYIADDEMWPGRRRPAIFMRHWMSRITLEVTGVRVERLQSISESDALAEGVKASPVIDGWSVFREDGSCYWTPQIEPPVKGEAGGCGIVRDFVPQSVGGYFKARDNFKHLWREINGAESWDANPYVWCIEFRRAQP